MEFINKAKQKAQHVELYQVHVTETPVRYENNKLKTIDTSDRKVNALRVVKDGKLGFATSTDADLDHLLDMALATAEFGRPWQAALPSQGELPQIDLIHPSTAVEIDAMVDTGAEVIKQLRECHPEVLASARLSTRKSTVRLVNSQGFDGEYSKNMLSMTGILELTEGKNMLSLYASFSSGKLEDQVQRKVRQLVENFQHGRTNVPIQSGNYTVIFSPFCLGDILRPLLACAEGKAVEKGFSPWKDKLGEKLFTPQLSLYDDATIPFAPASCPFDGEGVAARRTAIIQDGRVNSFILDLATAHALGMKPTGNGFRSQPDSLPGPGYSNIVLELTETQPLEQLIGSVQQGIIIHSLMGAWAGNPYSGQVSGNIDLGFLIQDGQIKGRVKDCMVSVDCFRAFREQIAGASTEKEWAWNMFLPHLMLGDVSINAKG